MDPADIQLVVGLTSSAVIVIVAVYNGWINSRRSREERTSPSYADLLDQLKRGDAKIKDLDAKLEKYGGDRDEMMNTITELRAELASERAARQEILDDAARFIDAIGRHVLGQAVMPVLPSPFVEAVDQEVWRQVPLEQRRFRLPGESYDMWKPPEKGPRDGDQEERDTGRG